MTKNGDDSVVTLCVLKMILKILASGKRYLENNVFLAGASLARSSKKLRLNRSLGKAFYIHFAVKP